MRLSIRRIGNEIPPKFRRSANDGVCNHENEKFEEIKESDSDLEILENDQDVKTLESDELKKVSNNNNSEVADQTLVID